MDGADARQLGTRNARLLRLATYASISVALALIVLKAAAWYMSGSVSLLASLIDSLMDAGASLINLVAIAYALTPADKGHRFGHGKAEALAGLAQSVFIAASALLVLQQGIDHLLHPRPVEAAWVGVAVMLVSILATLGLLGFQRHVIRHTGSTAIRADALHYRSDLLMNISIIVALILAYYGLPGADALFGIAIALLIGFSALQIGRDAVQILMDHELPDAVRKEALALARAVPGVIDVHDLRTRESGQQWFMQLHLELPGELSLTDAHELGEQVRHAIIRRFPQADVLVHKDPVHETAAAQTPTAD
ncbi:putative transporter [Pseudomonas saudimassiliensis]|uniref:Cation-efflux pump FieF n=1 Tax=Pseudomonas saudimassiliensis TaxID=1461581 RepID=A0A078MI17_9PSED|nr:cation diffusion facilitator family transporter [Pseudomonas saudimassiliensis]CEA05945.1 putative transporter [Pseudomonas saudimassiliensis]CEF27405.1 putative transporter [Pseudomonas saudimassiliensis]